MSIAFFDVESASADLLYRWDKPEPYVRLCGVAMDDGPVWVTQNTAHLIAALERAEWICAHNGLSFDLPALARYHGADYDALAAKCIDTLPWAILQDPPGSKGAKPWGVKGYYSLDQLSHRLGGPGKTDNLPALAVKWAERQPGVVRRFTKDGRPKDEWEYQGRVLTREQMMVWGFGVIPPTDPDYVAYLRGDVEAQRDTFRRMGGLESLDAYARREMRVTAAKNRMTMNGWRVNVPEVTALADAEAQRKREAELWLSEHCGMPLTKTETKGRGANKVTVEVPVKAPMSTNAGKVALERAFREAGAVHVPRTPPSQGFPNGQLALSKDAMSDGMWMRGSGASGQMVPGMRKVYGHLPGVVAICERVALVSTAVQKYQEIVQHLVGDRVHGYIGSDQASGRWAMVKPSLTNLGKRDGKVVQRAPFLPEPGHVLISADLDQVDMRGIAAHCQDSEYIKLFEPGRDVHSEIAVMCFGTAENGRREYAKKCGHGENYGMSVKGLINSGVDPQVAQRFMATMQERFPRRFEWREEVRDRAAAGELLDNGFGRLMRCDPGKAHTQAPALMGQGAARDIMCESILRFLDAMPEGVHWLRGVVHDEIVLSVPQERAEEVSQVLVAAMSWEWKGVPISAGVSQPGLDWASCYAKG